ncbi:amidohydrolase 2 [Grosmannia clavigera kw1407]|uniref:Amidohydrolase 2 n=1 Tax=Grosmannia clavigera (strain kw1407 / UAMH 11150) TaxID=655863 RepID=F0XUC8_GROCL|nr:amidohydrolase 2 [Grosmannia clavigera kw1407]EFW98595.1 amidohydrolase 2 [Grosmannia clavigera kw1407]
MWTIRHAVLPALTSRQLSAQGHHRIHNIAGVRSAAAMVPEGAWDTHIHVFEPDRFPYAEPRRYTPKAAALTAYPAAARTGCTNIVVVHASMQGQTAAPLVDLLRRQETDPQIRSRFGVLRGLTALDPDAVTDDELDALHKAGVRGCRLHENAADASKAGVVAGIAAKIEALARRTARLGWIVDVFCPLAVWAALADKLRSSSNNNRIDPRVHLVADHLASTLPGAETTLAFRELLALVRERRLFVKLSGFDRLYHDNDGIDSLAAAIKALVAAGPDQILFGSDWPHTQLDVNRAGKTAEQRLHDVEGFRHVDNAAHIAKLREWIPDDETWHKLWVANPQRLFA